MVAHQCIQATKIALADKTMTDMVEKINKIDNDLFEFKNDYKSDINSIKDMIWTIKLTAQKDNSDIKLLLQELFKANNTEIKTWAEKKFASKMIERVWIWFFSIWWWVVAVAFFNFVMKWIWKT